MLPKNPPTVPVNLARACSAYRAETGRLPTQTSGDATKWTGEPVTWSAIDARLRKAGSSLSKFLTENAFRDKPVIPLPQIVLACHAFHEAHGRWPTCASGDAEPYIGVPIHWSGIDRQLRAKGSSLSAVKKAHGLVAPEGLSKDAILGACKAFYADQGRWPSNNSGRADQWAGRALTWASINHRLVRLGEGGLSKFLDGLGIKVGQPVIRAPRTTRRSKWSGSVLG